jgi:hypothetical protein
MSIARDRRRRELVRTGKVSANNLPKPSQTVAITPGPSLSSTPAAPDDPTANMLGRIGVVMDELMKVAGNHPLGRPMMRTGKAMLKELNAKLQDGEFKPEDMREKVTEFAAALKWISDAPSVYAKRPEVSDTVTVDIAS